MTQFNLQNYLLSKPEATEDYPFDPETAVYRIKDKMFALVRQTKGIEQVNLKCDPQQALMLRDMFEAVIPGYHMNKTHWNTLIMDGSVPVQEIQSMIDHSYSLVVKGLRKSEREGLEVRHGQSKLYTKSLLL